MKALFDDFESGRVDENERVTTAGRRPGFDQRSVPGKRFGDIVPFKNIQILKSSGGQIEGAVRVSRETLKQQAKDLKPVSDRCNWETLESSWAMLARRKM